MKANHLFELFLIMPKTPEQPPVAEKGEKMEKSGEISELDLPRTFIVAIGGNKFHDLMSIQIKKDGAVVNQFDKPLRREEISAALDRAAGVLHGELKQAEKEVEHKKNELEQLRLAREFLKKNVKAAPERLPSG